MLVPYLSESIWYVYRVKEKGSIIFAVSIRQKHQGMHATPFAARGVCILGFHARVHDISIAPFAWTCSTCAWGVVVSHTAIQSSRGMHFLTISLMQVRGTKENVWPFVDLAYRHVVVGVHGPKEPSRDNRVQPPCLPGDQFTRGYVRTKLLAHLARILTIGLWRRSHGQPLRASVLLCLLTAGFYSKYIHADTQPRTTCPQDTCAKVSTTKGTQPSAPFERRRRSILPALFFQDRQPGPGILTSWHCSKSMWGYGARIQGADYYQAQAKG
jgi:hypothetical protein